MILNLSLVFIELWLAAGLVVFLHWISPRYGLTPFFMLLGMLLAMLRLFGLIQPFVRVSSFLVFGLTGNVLVPVIVFSILLVYVAQGTLPARIVIFCGLALDALFSLMIVSIRLHISMPGGVSFAGITPQDAVLMPSLLTTIASSGAFFIDLFIVAIVYQALQNKTPRLPGWLRTGVTLVAALSINSVAFSSLNLILGISDFERFFARLPGRVLGQTLSALMLLPIAAYYLQQVAPRLPGFIGFAPRPTFDLIFGAQGQIERRLHETQMELLKTEEAYQNLADEIGYTTHDLKNPLTTLQLRLYSLARSQDPAEQLGLIRSAETQVRTLSDLIDDLLMLSQLSDTPLLDTQPVDINSLAQRVYEAVQPVAASKEQILSFKRSPQPLVVNANGSELTRAFTNLSMNAFLYTPEQGTIELETAAQEGFAVFKVSDTGIGIREDQLPKIWERFYRIQDDTQDKRPGGTGLGLAIVKKVVDRHDGDIEVTSQEGEGATFAIKLKLQQPVA